ncbi:hypothetical protein BX070DRAFT_667 [Coemansia spiralis]|nr:hypothetical protein BX070DRAFT_667 [Coemansia spiralis]
MELNKGGSCTYVVHIFSGSKSKNKEENIEKHTGYHINTATDCTQKASFAFFFVHSRYCIFLAGKHMLYIHAYVLHFPSASKYIKPFGHIAWSYCLSVTIGWSIFDLLANLLYRKIPLPLLMAHL